MRQCIYGALSPGRSTPDTRKRVIGLAHIYKGLPAPVRIVYDSEDIADVEGMVPKVILPYSEVEKHRSDPILRNGVGSGYDTVIYYVFNIGRSIVIETERINFSAVSRIITDVSFGRSHGNAETDGLICKQCRTSEMFAYDLHTAVTLENDLVDSISGRRVNCLYLIRCRCLIAVSQHRHKHA